MIKGVRKYEYCMRCVDSMLEYWYDYFYESAYNLLTWNVLSLKILMKNFDDPVEEEICSAGLKVIG